MRYLPMQQLQERRTRPAAVVQEESSSIAVRGGDLERNIIDSKSRRGYPKLSAALKAGSLLLVTILAILMFSLASEEFSINNHLFFFTSDDATSKFGSSGNETTANISDGRHHGGDDGGYGGRRTQQHEQQQCAVVGKLFPPALPVTPNQRDKTASAYASEEWFDLHITGRLENALAWNQLAMPNTATTSMEYYMSHGVNMSPLQRSGGCNRACISRIGPSQVRGYAKLLSPIGVDSHNLQACDPDVFYNLSVIRCFRSGRHMDYDVAVKDSKVILRWNKTIHKGIRPLLSRAAVLGTTIRDPIFYHYKLFGGVPTSGHVPFDHSLCRFWADKFYNNATASRDSAGMASNGFYCVREDNRWLVASEFEPYMEFAHHRWNLFTRFLAGTLLPTHIPIHDNSKIVEEIHNYHFTREQAIKQNELGPDAPDYTSAIAHLEAMPHFSIFERMSESIELLCFTYCYNCKDLGFSYEPHKHPPIPEGVREAVNPLHRLDVMLYKHANEIFSKRVEHMRKAQANGVQCDMLLSGCALSCTA